MVFGAHSTPLFAKLGILDIFQVNSFQIAKFMFYYQNQLLPPMFLNLSYQVAKCIIMAPEQPTTIDRILVEQIL